MLKIWIRYPHLLSTRIHIGVAITKMSLSNTVTLWNLNVIQGWDFFFVIFGGLWVWLLPRRNSWLNFRMHPRERCWEARTYYFPPLGVVGGGFAGVRERKSARAQDQRQLCKAGAAARNTNKEARFPNIHTHILL